MKKVFGILMVILFGVSLSGCTTNSTIICTKEEENNIKDEITLSFKNDKLKIMTIKTETELDTEKEAESVLNSLNKMYENDKNESGITIKLKQDGTKVYFSISYELAKLSDKMMEDFDYENEKIDKASVVKTYEEDGFSCKKN